jgi:hypothetical protein
MKRRLLTITFVLVLALGLISSVSAQDAPYYFSVEKEVVNVLWNSDGTQSLDYVWNFANQPNGHSIEFVDVGMPSSNFDTATITADVDGVSVSISGSDYAGSGSGFAVVMGSHSIPPGGKGVVHVYVGRISGVLYPDDNDEAYASAVFSPTYFDSQYVAGNTDITMTFHLPPNVQPEEPRYHPPEGWPGTPEPQSGFDSQDRITYTWSAPNANMFSEYKFGASFPKSYVPADAIITAPPFDLAGLIGGIIGSLGPLLFCGFFAFMFVGMPIIAAVQGRNRKLQYIPPRIAIEGHGIKRGLTAVEAGIIMEQPLDKVMTMILFGAVKKNAAVVATRNPLVVTVSDPLPPELHEYEVSFLKAFKQQDEKARRKDLQKTIVDLVKSVSEKIKGFSRKETIEYYKRIMETAWEQVQKADTPEVQSVFFDQQLEWTMLDQDYDDRSRRTFNRPIFMPMWWGNYDPSYRGMTSQARPLSTSVPSQPSGRSMPQLPGADFAASMVTGVQTFSQKVIGNVSDFTSGVTNVTNPPPKPSSSRSGGGGGRSCACACACAGCACACAGGGR